MPLHLKKNNIFYKIIVDNVFFCVILKLTKNEMKGKIMRKENKEKLDKIFYHFKENIFKEEEYREYASRTTNLMVAFEEWIESYTDLSEAVYKVFGSDDERLVNKIQKILNKGVTSFFDKASKPYWEVA